MSGKHRPPEGNIRRSQVLTSAGPGAIVDLIDYAVIIKGLDDWQYSDAEGDTFIREPRLEEEALKMLRGSGHWKFPHVRLRKPPATPDDESRIGPWHGMHAREFPIWYQCRGCRSLVRRDSLDEQRRHVCFAGDEKPKQAVPVRFVAGCTRGHLTNINWRRFVHRGEIEEGAKKPYHCSIDDKANRRRTTDGRIFLGDLALVSTGTSGDLSDLAVVCRRCGKSRSLQDLRQPHALGNCFGWRPWLANEDDTCDQELRLLIRTGSNVWFPQRLSALHIPEEHDTLGGLVNKHWDALKDLDDLDQVTLFVTKLPDLRDAFRGFEPDEIWGAILAKRHSDDDNPPQIREVEWNKLYNAEYGFVHDLPSKGEPWFARRIELDQPPAFVDRVVLVHALREVRAMVGFTRIDGVPISAEGDIQVEGQRTAPLSENQDWIPAVEINGEGVFIAFSETAIREWESRDAVKERAQQFRDGLQIDNESRKSGVANPFQGARLLLLHSIAHMLISQISLECGYSASAIRERIYCYRDDDDPSKSRAGILLYTGTPGSEGTLGGLVEVGAEIVRHLKLAAQRNLICSNDPVCAQHRPDGPEDGRRQEGAACHGCLLIAEPSCERMNRDLDRAMVVPTLEMADAAFLKGWV